MSLAGVILTLNEQRHIEETIASLKKVADEILVIDSGSTDRTVELAEKSGAKVFFRAWDNDFSAQRNFALDKTSADWILYIDADERITDELAESIRNAISEKGSSILSFRRHNIAFGKEFRFGVFRPDTVTRLFPRTQARWTGLVHERIESNLPEKTIKGHLIHYPYENWEQYLVKFNSYTTLWANEAYARGKKSSLPGAYIRASFSFIKIGFFNLGILDGIMGLITSSLHFKYTLIKYLKLYRMRNNNQEDVT